MIKYKKYFTDVMKRAVIGVNPKNSGIKGKISSLTIYKKPRKNEIKLTNRKIGMVLGLSRRQVSKLRKKKKLISDESILSLRRVQNGI